MNRVLLLHTGGTLGMTGSPLGPGSDQSDLLNAVPQLSQIADVSVDIVCNLDSSDVSADIWTELATRLHSRRDDFDGFVIIHGTDTMAYTANALSYALANFGKPIVLTGAQRPLAEVRTDANRNLIDAVTVATTRMPEVAICFDGLLLRGCRTTKESARDYRAFASPGTEPIARLGVDIGFVSPTIRQQGPLSFLPSFGGDVAVLFATPALTVSQIETVSSANGVVLVTLGLGTVPSLDGKSFDALEAIINANVPVVAITTAYGEIDFGLYPNSRRLEDCGVLPGGRLGLESAVVKMMHGLENFSNELGDYLLRNVAGEHG